jgi:hypothetical protein
MKWYVGGARIVDKTFLAIHPLSLQQASPLQNTSNWSLYLQSLPSDTIMDGLVNTSGSSVAERDLNTFKIRGISPKIISPIFSGTGRWDTPTESTSSSSSSTTSSHSETNYASSDPLKPKTEYYHSLHIHKLLSGYFRNKRNLEESSPLYTITNSTSTVSETNNSNHTRSASSGGILGKFWIVAWSVVDSNYGMTSQGYPSGLGPMSHYANIRTNSNWHCATVGKDQRTCQGRRYWPSDFIELILYQDGNIQMTKAVLHCAWWNYTIPFAQQQQSPQPKKGINSDLHNEDEDSIFSIRKSRGTLGTVKKAHEKQFDSFSSHVGNENEDLDESFQRYYLGYFIGMIFLTLLVWYIANIWRRNRVYMALISNKYLNLPTGFQPAPVATSADTITSTIPMSQTITV